VGACLVALGGLYLCYLVTIPRDAVFFSGDGGLKYLLSQQFLNGDVSPVLQLTATSTGERLWESGLYPFHGPFVYSIEGRRVVSFPLYFPLASTPFVAIMGWRGLYVLPALSVLLLWAWLTHCWRSSGVGAPGISAGLMSAIFAAPLTLYGAIFWEHAPAAFLTSISLVLVIPRARECLRPVTYLVTGLVSGTAVFLRPESIVAVPIFVAATLLCYRNEKWREALIFSTGFAASVGSFLLANHLIYGSPLGLHAHQVIEGAPLFVPLIEVILARAGRFFVEFVRYWPHALFLMAFLPQFMLKASPRRRGALACFVAVLVSVPAVAAIVPNDGGRQWGPRYLMILMPWALYALGTSFDSTLRIASRGLRAASLAAFILLFILGFSVNTWEGRRELARDYRGRILPVKRIVEERPEQFVLVSHWWIAQELASLSQNKTFLWARSYSDYMQARSSLLQDGHDTVLLITVQQFIPSSALGQFTILGHSEHYSVRLVRLED
jgi:hypothetical protein